MRILTFIFVILSLQGICQKTLYEDADSLNMLGTSILSSEDHQTRIESSKKYTNSLKKILASPDFDDKILESVKNLSVQKEKDLAIYTWVVPSPDRASFVYHGIIKYRRENMHSIFELTDKSDSIMHPETTKTGPGKWYGAVYYKMIPRKKGKKKYYTLLGWKGNNASSTKKVIEILEMQGNTPVFGSPMIKTDQGLRHRIVFEYNAEASMSLHYYEKKSMIIFDHLSPPNAGLLGVYPTYGPDFSYDALIEKGNRWVLKKDILPENEDRKTKKFDPPQRGLMPQGNKKN